MARRLALGYALIATLWCVQAAAIGLGDITIHSALNQPLNAEIELLQAQGMSESEIVAQLATAEDFKRVGVERFFFLTGLQFHVEMRAGTPVLRVTSAQPITEPYLNFLVQVIWPNGRLLKEFTVLLDPPTYKEQAAPAVASPGRSDPGGGSAGRVERTPTRPDSEVSLSNTPRSTPPASQSPPSDRLTGDSYGVTDRDDTLWRIAQRARPAANVTVQQTMLAIARLNPHAFIGGNINLLKAGYTLRLPSAEDATTLSTADAVSEVAAQNEAWQGYRRGEGLARTQPADGSTQPAESQALAGQVDATATAPAKPAVAGPDGELRIVAGDEGGTGTGGGSADVASLEGELAATKEETDRISRERDEAVSKLDQVASQAEQSQRQIEVRDQQIAQMQQQLKALQQTGGTPAAAPAEPRAQAGGIASLLTSPLVLGIAGIVVVLIVVAGLMRVRSRRRDADPLDALGESVVDDASVHARGAVAAFAADGAESDPDLDEPVVPTEEHDAPSHEVAQTSDVIGEADIYIAYGRYPQAISLLLSALEDDPNRSDVRVKLLEVYAETKDEASFETHMTELLARCDDNEILLEARDLETKLREDQPVSVEVAAEEPPAPAEEEFQLDLDETDGDASPPKVSTSVAPAAGDLGGDLGIDFKVDDEPAAPRPHASASAVRAQASRDDVAVATADDEGEFDLEDLEFEPQGRSAPKAQSRTAAKGVAADDAFDFLNEEDAATTKLDLARAYIDMGDTDGAREILGEVLQEGSNEQQQVANELLAKLK
jgi:pilus assembly protein FimV